MTTHAQPGRAIKAKISGRVRVRADKRPEQCVTTAQAYPHRHRLVQRALRHLCLLTIACTVILAADKAGGPPPAAVQVANVQLLPVAPTVKLVGTIHAVQQVALPAQQSGVMTALLVKTGESVKAGQVIARQDDRHLQAQLKSAVAAISVAEARIQAAAQDLQQSKNENTIIQEAAKERAASTIEAQRAHSAVAVATATLTARQAALAEAKAKRDEIQLALDDLAITAPFAGNVVMEHVDVGAWLEPGTPIITLTSHELEVQADVPERHWAGIQAAQAPLHIQTAFSKTIYQTEAMQVQRLLNASARTAKVIATLPAAAHALLAEGLTAQVHLPVGARNKQLVVPRPAVIRGAGRDMVFVVHGKPDTGYTAVPQGVTILFETAQGYAVDIPDGKASVLQDHSLVVIEGNERLRPGSALRLLNKPAASTTNTATQP